MELFIWFNRRFGNPLEWSSAAKATLLLVVTLVMHIGYGAWAYMVLKNAGTALPVNMAYLQSQLPNFYHLIIASCLLTLFFPLSHRLFGDSVAYEHLAANYYGLSHCYYAYLIGTLTLPVGIVLAGGPVLGFIFCNRIAISLAFMNSGLALVLLSVMAAQGSIAYAPMVHQFVMPDGRVSEFWVGNFIFYSLPHLVILFGLAFLVLRRWREREEQARILSRIDPLTGLYNRRSILAHLHREQDRSGQQGLPMAVVMVDLDHFKTINDTWGHDMGDAALVAVSGALQDAVRKHDYVGRYGGEEFLVLLADLDREHAKYLAERIRSAIAGINLSCADGSSLHLSASLGMSFYTLDGNMSVEDLIRRADQALYRAKHAGRDRLEIAA